MLKPSDNPPQLLPGLERVSDTAGPWWVAHTKARVEKALAWELTAKKVPYFLPMARRTQMSGGRRRTALLPLFTSYVFFCGDDRARGDVLTTRRVCQILPVRQRDAFVRELASVHAALQADPELKLYPFAVVGRRCRVAKGPMRGVEGVIVQDNDVTRLVLQVAVLGQGAVLEIDAAFLEDCD